MSPALLLIVVGLFVGVLLSPTVGVLLVVIGALLLLLPELQR